MNSTTPQGTAKLDTRAIYHPGPDYETFGYAVEWLARGAAGVRFRHRFGGHDTTADFTTKEALKLGL